MNLHEDKSDIAIINREQLSKTEVETMNYYIQKVREINEEKIIKTGKYPLMLNVTFGCQMNVHDSEKLKGLLDSMLYKETENEKDADLIIFNTCCVRENAENKVYGNLGLLKSMKQANKNLKIIVCGCMMQQNSVIEKIKESYKMVDIIFGTFNLYRLPQLLYTSLETKGMIVDVWEEHTEIIEDLPSIREKPFKASVNIMYGCNNFCSYCIVPYVRGRERSREVDDILKEIEGLASEGVVEVVLLGQNVNSYGKNLEGNVNFSYLLKKINKIEGIERIRFMTSHPKDLSPELIYTIRDCEKICNYIHLPFQAGSTKTLEKMNRKYTKEDYLALVEKIKKEIPEISITTDIIVGFPGETEEDFIDTLDVVKKVRFSGAFTFLYSIRTGTPAAIMADQIPEAIAKKRFNQLLDTLDPIVYEISKGHVGKKLKVLAEDVNENDHTIITGRSEDNSIVHFIGTKEHIGKIINVKITDCKTYYLIGEII